MKRSLVLALAMSLIASVAVAKDAKTVKVASLPVCGMNSSLGDILGDRCLLVKGSNPWGDMTALNDIANGLASVGGAGGPGGIISGM